MNELAHIFGVCFMWLAAVYFFAAIVQLVIQFLSPAFAALMQSASAAGFRLRDWLLAPRSKP